MMSRKHYKEIAIILSQLNKNIQDSQEKADLYMEIDSSFHTAILQLSGFFKCDNPNFNGSKFRDVVFANARKTK